MDQVHVYNIVSSLHSVAAVASLKFCKNVRYIAPDLSAMVTQYLTKTFLGAFVIMGSSFSFKH